VERLLDTIMNLGVSEATTRRLKAEAKLVELRGKLTALARSAKPKKVPAIDVETRGPAVSSDLVREGPGLRLGVPPARRRERGSEAGGRGVRSDPSPQKLHGRHRWRPC